MQRFRGGLVFKDNRLLYHSTLGLRVIKKKKEGERKRETYDSPDWTGLNSQPFSRGPETTAKSVTFSARRNATQISIAGSDTRGLMSVLSLTLELRFRAKKEHLKMF